MLALPLLVIMTISTNAFCADLDNVEHIQRDSSVNTLGKGVIYNSANDASHDGYDLIYRAFDNIVNDINGNEKLKDKRQWAYPHKRQWAFPHKRQWAFPHKRQWAFPHKRQWAFPHKR